MISTTTTTVVAVKVQKSPWTDFLTGDKFKVITVIESNLATKKCIADAMLLSGS